MTSSSPEPEENRIIGGRYRLEELLGRGGMGEVWRARHLVLKSQVALKLLHASSAPDEATKMAALCAANVLRAVRRHFGSLDRIDRVLRITGYVNSDPGFTEQHLVINGASCLVRDVFGEDGRHARPAGVGGRRGS